MVDNVNCIDTYNKICMNGHIFTTISYDNANSWSKRRCLFVAKDMRYGEIVGIVSTKYMVFVAVMYLDMFFMVSL